MLHNTTIPVLIVGAGPTGLVAALTLRQNGIPVRIIEKEETVRAIGQRGAGIMPRSQELFNILGVIKDVHARAIPIIPPIRMYKLPGGTDPISTFAVDPVLPPTPSKPYSNAAMLGQCFSEEILRNHLERLGCMIEQGATLHRIEQEETHVQARIVKKDGDQDVVETVQCSWLIGTDGGRGIVRKQLGVAFDGVTFGAAHHLVIGDIHVKGLDRKYWHYWGDMSTIMVMLRPTEEEDIFFIMLGGQIDYAKIVAERAEFERVVKSGTGRTDIKLGRIRSLAEYRPSARMAGTFRKGRVFLAGDAAHIHTPFGGQGLNSSIQDAANLGWKLSLVEKRIAAPSLLDSYTEERLPVIAHMLKTSTKLFNTFGDVKADGTNSEAAWSRGNDLHMFGVNYRWSAIIVDERTPKEAAPADPYGLATACTDVVRAGDRAPDAPNLAVMGAIPENAHGTEPTRTTSLFRLLGLSHHTVLVFSDGTDKATNFVSSLQDYPADLVRKVVIHTAPGPHCTTRATPDDRVAEVCVVDRGGHAHEGYQVQNGEFIVVIVRPDGVVGGIVRSVEGAKQYFHTVFSAIA